MLTPNGGVFGRNPKFNNVTVENNLTVNGDVTLGDDIVINDTLLVNGQATFSGGVISTVTTAATSGTVVALEARANSTGTPAAGFATGFDLQNEYAPGTFATGARLTANVRTVTAGSERSDMGFSVREVNALSQRMLLEAVGAATVLNVTAAATGYANLELEPGSGGFGQVLSTGSLFITTGSATDMILRPGGSETARFTSSGNLNISNGNLVIGTSGKGIDFAITSDGTGTMTSELLSDYEEGTFTPGISFGSGTTGITYADRGARYTKIGRMVMVNGYVALSNKGTSTGVMAITGLPFSVPGDAGAFSAPCIDAANITNSGQISGVGSGTTILLTEFDTAGVRTQLANGDFANNSELIFTFWYATT